MIKGVPEWGFTHFDTPSIVIVLILYRKNYSAFWNVKPKSKVSALDKAGNICSMIGLRFSGTFSLKIGVMIVNTGESKVLSA